jgi:hypothetical protein
VIRDPYIVVIVICAALFILGVAAGLPLGYRWGHAWGAQDAADAAQLAAQLAPVPLDDGPTEPLRALDIRDPVDLMIWEARIYG